MRTTLPLRDEYRMMQAPSVTHADDVPHDLERLLTFMVCGTRNERWQVRRSTYLYCHACNTSEPLETF